MRIVTVNHKFDNKHLDLFLMNEFPFLVQNTFYKALRKKDIRVNNVKISENVIVHEGDEITLYILDKYLLGKEDNINIVYEDENILILNKPKSLEVIGENSLTELISKKYNMPLYPCHRLDRNTEGLILFAKSNEVLDILLLKFKTQEITKIYRCNVLGTFKKKHDVLKAFLFKDTKKSMVYISKEVKKGYRPIITEYTVLDENKDKNFSTLEVILHTGRTHQIRAHLASIGHPIIGDGKYGINEVNKKFNSKTQALVAYKLRFDFKTDAGILNYLKNKEFKISKVDLLNGTYFSRAVQFNLTFFPIQLKKSAFKKIPADFLIINSSNFLERLVLILMFIASAHRLISCACVTIIYWLHCYLF